MAPRTKTTPTADETGQCCNRGCSCSQASKVDPYMHPEMRKPFLAGALMAGALAFISLSSFCLGLGAAHHMGYNQPDFDRGGYNQPFQGNIGNYYGAPGGYITQDDSAKGLIAPATSVEPGPLVQSGSATTSGYAPVAPNAKG